MPLQNYSGWWFSVSALNPGEYILDVIDKKTGDHAGILFLKL